MINYQLPDSSQFGQIVEWWRQEPTIFVKEILGVNLWSKQKEIIESVRDNPRTSVRSASAVGKTMVAACIVLWFLYSFYPSTVITTGKSFRQVKEQLWREIRARHAQAQVPLGGNITKEQLDLAENWFALGFSTDEPDRITGYHNKHILEIVDEGCGVPDEVYSALENPLAAGFTRQLILGNPTQSVGKFKDSCTSPKYKHFHISAFDTPSFTGEGDFPFLINKEYIEWARGEWGEDSPLYEVYIKGDFPSGETDRLIPFGLAELAISRDIKPEGIIAIGVDTARFGDDENVLYVRQGNKVIGCKTWRKCDTEATIGQIVHELKKHKPEIVNIDEGYNPGVIDALRAQKFNINGISFGGKAKNTKTFANARAEMYWELAQRFKQGEIQIPNDKVLLKQITDIKKKPLNRFDQIILESKQEMKQRGLKSPDRADALALCFYEVSLRKHSPLWFVEIGD